MRGLFCQNRRDELINLCSAVPQTINLRRAVPQTISLSRTVPQIINLHSVSQVINLLSAVLQIINLRGVVLRVINLFSMYQNCQLTWCCTSHYQFVFYVPKLSTYVLLYFALSTDVYDLTMKTKEPNHQHHHYRTCSGELQPSED